MKMRKITIFFAAMAVAAAAAGCSGSTEESKTEGDTAETQENQEDGVLTEEDDPEEIIKEMNELYVKEDMAGGDITSVNVLLDNSQEEYAGRQVSNHKDNIYYSEQEQSSGTPSKSFLKMEEDGYYYYENREDDRWIRYKAGEETTKYLERDSGGIFSEEDLQNIQYSNEGKEELEGTETVKIKVTAGLSAGEDAKVTRESTLADFGWSEESVAAVDGFSDLLDRYIAAQNEVRNTGYEGAFWVDVKTHMPVQSQIKWMSNNMDPELEKEFYGKSWEVSWIQNDMELGNSLEQTKANIEEQRAQMEAQIAADMEARDDSQMQKEYIVTTGYLYGEDCPQMPELPTEFEEMTEEQYFEYLNSLLNG